MLMCLHCNGKQQGAQPSSRFVHCLQDTAALSSLRMMLPDRTPLRGVDCSAMSGASGLTRLELLGHASADAVEAVSP